MESLTDKLAVVTGGGSGMGRELVIQLVAAGAAVATCDVNADALAHTRERAAEAGPGPVSVHECNVAERAQVERFRDEVTRDHGRAHVHLLFNNAGIGGGGSFVNDDRDVWERTFAVCWGGVYNTMRAFLPLLVAAPEAVIVNTSSVNGFWASLGPDVPHTAYSAAKFAVKGLTEALQVDLRVNAPHVRAVLVMPGHVGTDIVTNSARAHGNSVDDPMVKGFADYFRDHAPVSAAQAATVMLDAVRDGEWRVLIGDDAHRLDERVRLDPHSVYQPGGVTLPMV